jgi:hypothetical protein
MPLNPTQLLPELDRDTRINLEFPGMRRDVLLGPGGRTQIVRFVRTAPERSFIQYHRLAADEVDTAIDAQQAFIVENKLDFDWKVYTHDEPAGLAERLAARGWVADDPGAVMVLDLESAPAALLAPVTADVRPISTREGLRDVIAVLTPVWNANFDWVTRRLGDHLEIPGYLNVYVAYADNAPACAAWVYLLPGSRFASLWGGSTVAGQRGQGLYTAVLAARVQAARARGYRYLMIEAGEMSRPIVARHGFEHLTTMTAYEWKPA